ncbi:hypothetical protein [Streptomyces kronopolitis]|uniref:hypothetical protein n=1 Tax=Streptomyces kronopolitis TaxID=1612435 RepID=UPI0020BDF7F9|nr:hypothetical protein [Streptomyces kronopolitis]MCL6300501.1 hypothetical protein [Streptomyces kronopolitis]
MSSKTTEVYTFTAVVSGEDYYPDTHSVRGRLASSSQQEATTKIEASLRSRGYVPIELTVRKA